ncbi:MAG: hypothetical protein AAGF12_32645 [Myxococcota bacterium]
MAPLLTLIGTFVAARLWTGVRRDPHPTVRAARIALGVMLLVTGVAHFTATESMAQMLPPWFPGGVPLVYATGVFELALAGLLLLRSTHPMPSLGWVLALFFLGLLPANVYSAVAEVGLGGHGPLYLWFRIPLQILFIGWALVSTEALRHRPTTRATT